MLRPLLTVGESLVEVEAEMVAGRMGGSCLGRGGDEVGWEVGEGLYAR